MESQRLITKKYLKLLEDVATKEFYTKIDLTNRVNCYICSCGHITKTKDVDPGVTPFIHSCEKCGGKATSTFYNDILPARKPTQEWYRPTLKQVLKMRNRPGMLEHVLSGGLEVRNVLGY
jgi:hypothetical protein